MDILFDKTSELLNHSNGIAYGENHLSPNAGQWIKSKLEELQGLGVTTVFLEIDRDQQAMLDDFESGSINEQEMRDAISQMNDTASEDIIIEAKRLGIQIVAVDTDIDPTPYLDDNGRPTAFPSSFDVLEGKYKTDDYDNDRLNYSNPSWADRVTDTMASQPDGAKYVMLVGAAHTNLTDDPRYRGVDKILGIPSIDIFSEQDVQNNNSLSGTFGHAVIDSSITQSNEPAVIDHPTKNGATLAAFVPKDM